MNFWYNLLKYLLKFKGFFTFFIVMNIGASFMEIHLYATIAKIASGEEPAKFLYILFPISYFMLNALSSELLYIYSAALTKSDFEDTWRLSEQNYLNRNSEWQLTTITKYFTNYIGRNYASIYVPSLLGIQKLVFVFVLVFYMSLLHGYFTFILLPIFILCLYVLFSFTKRLFENWGYSMTQSVSDRIDIISSYFGAFKDNLINEQSIEHRKRFDLITKIFVHNQKLLNVTPQHLRSLIELCLYISIIASIYLQLVADALFITIVFLTLRTLPAFQVISGAVNQINSNKTKFLQYLKTISKHNVNHKVEYQPVLFKTNGSDIKIGKISFDLTGQSYKIPSYNLKKSDILLIRGPSGSGKSTILDALAGLTGFIGASNVVNEPLLLTPAKISYCSQDIQFVSGTVFEILRVKDEQEFADHCGATAHALGIYNILIDLQRNNRKLEIDNKQLSGGQLKRFGILRCLISEADIYLFDEPEAGLDQENIKSLYELLKKTKKTCIVVSHSQSIQEITCNVFDVKHGKIEEVNVT